jgi:hypothetical protein
MFVFLSLIQVCWQGTFAALAFIDKALAPTKRAQTAINLIAQPQTHPLAPLPAPMLPLKV